MSRELTPAQQMMVDDGMPAELMLTRKERAEAWNGKRLRPTNSFVEREPTREEDASTERFRAELEAKARAEAARKRAADKEARIIRERRKVAPATAAEAAEETDVKKASAKKAPKGKKAKARHPKQGPVTHRANKARVKKASTSKARTPVETGKRDVVATIAAMMARPLGHKDAPLGGASMDEMTKETGIEAHPMRAKIKLVRDRLNYTMEIKRAPKPNGEGNENRYHAAPPKGAPTGLDAG